MFCEAKLNIGRFKETIGFFKANKWCGVVWCGVVWCGVGGKMVDKM